MALQSLRRLERLTDMQAPPQIIQNEHAIIDRHIAALGARARQVIAEFPRYRLQILGQEAEVKAWERRCDTCRYIYRGGYTDDEATWTRWCDKYETRERPECRACPHYDDKVPC